MGLFGGTTTTKVEPWKPQGQALEYAFGQAKSIYDAKKDTPFYTGDLHAGLDPLTQRGINQAGIYAQGAGQAGADTVSGVSTGLAGSSGDYMGAIRGLYGAASADPTGMNITNAGRYADNPYINGQIDAVGSDIRRNLTENTMPSIDRAATATGNINSSRAGVAEGIAQRGANEDLIHAASGIRSSAYNTGLGLSEQARGTNLQGMQGAGGLYGNAVGQGLSGLGQGQEMNTGLINSMVQSGQISQQDAQGLMDANFARWQGSDNRQQGLLDNYYKTIGSNKWGETTTQSTSGGVLGKVLGAAATIGSMLTPAGAMAKIGSTALKTASGAISSRRPVAYG